VVVVVQALLVWQQLALHKHSQIQWRIGLVLAARVLRSHGSLRVFDQH
jgi:hypothetical protein